MRLRHSKLWKEDALLEAINRVVERFQRRRPSDKFGKTKLFYQTFGGGCRKMFTKNGRVCEFPYSLEKAIVCKQSGPHPHRQRLIKGKSF